MKEEQREVSPHIRVAQKELSCKFFSIVPGKLDPKTIVFITTQKQIQEKLELLQVHTHLVFLQTNGHV